MFFLHISYVQLWQSAFSAEQNNLGNLGLRHYEEYLCKITLNLDLGIFVEGIMKNISVKLFWS